MFHAICDRKGFWRFSVVRHTGLHAIMELADHIDEFCGATKFWHDLPKSLTTDCIKCFCQINESCVETYILFTAFFLQLPGCNDHVNSTSPLSKPTLGFREDRPTCVARTGPRSALSKGQKSKFRKNKNFNFFFMSQWVLCPKIRLLGKKLWPVAREQTDRQTEVLITEYPMRASAFQASACDMSGPTWSSGLYLETFLSVFQNFDVRPF